MLHGVRRPAVARALQEQVERFLRFSKVPPLLGRQKRPPLDAVPDFLNGRTLRDYQVESLKWHVNNLRAGRNCILGDEMVRPRPEGPRSLEGLGLVIRW